MSRDDATKTRLNKLQSRGSGINPKTGRRFSANTSSRSSDTDKDFRGRSTDDSNIGRRAMFSGKSSTYGSSRGKGEQRRKLPYHKKESFQIKGETFCIRFLQTFEDTWSWSLCGCVRGHGPSDEQKRCYQKKQRSFSRTVRRETNSSRNKASHAFRS